MTEHNQKIKVAIIGTGNIGTDLLFKVISSKYLECRLFAGRNPNSQGISIAKSKNIPTSSDGIISIVKEKENLDLVFDATSAVAHVKHWEILEALGIPVIDLTPAKLGQFCVPAIIDRAQLWEGVRNYNMITCGGQASIPIAYAISKIHPEIEYIEVVSSIASLSAGPATRANLDEYIATTENALLTFSGAKRSKAVLILNPAEPPIEMQTTIYAKIENPKLESIEKEINETINKVQNYLPGYKLILGPIVEREHVIITIKAIGNGDFLPKYAGNLDIINSAAVAIAERFSKGIRK